MQTLVLNKDAVTNKQSHLTKQPSPHPLSSYINKVSTSLNLGSNDTYNGKKGQILGQHHDSRGLIDCLRPSVKNYAHPTLAEHFSSEKMKQFQSLEDSDRDCHQLTVKQNKEQTNTLRVFEVYSPDTITKAMDRSAIKENEKRTQGHMKQIAEYIDAKNIREFLSHAKG